jgi:mono/diheme cytochrome c family protein
LPHNRVTDWLIDNLRDRSIAVRARSIEVPGDLADRKRISAGAGLYTEMCSGCHLAPGMDKTELSQGLYPEAPELSRASDHSPAQQFWIIKHGVKLTAMPAWGNTHDDRLIWDMVAFVQQLPKLTPAQYQEMVESAPDHHQLMEDMHEPQSAPHEHAGPHSHADGGH